jgi:hypothetical protein
MALEGLDEPSGEVRVAGPSKAPLAPSGEGRGTIESLRDPEP